MDIPNEYKRLYGIALVHESNPYKAALNVFPNETGKALWINDFWLNDPEVIAAIQAERERIENEEMPGEKDALKLAWDMASNVGAMYADRLKALETFAKIKGLIKKDAGVVINNKQVIRQKVIAMPTFASDDDWEHAAEKQQREILNVATSRH